MAKARQEDLGKGGGGSPSWGFQNNHSSHQEQTAGAECRTMSGHQRSAVARAWEDLEGPHS